MSTFTLPRVGAFMDSDTAATVATATGISRELAELAVAVGCGTESAREDTRAMRLAQHAFIITLAHVYGEDAPARALEVFSTDSLRGSWSAASARTYAYNALRLMDAGFDYERLMELCVTGVENDKGKTVTVSLAKLVKDLPTPATDTGSTDTGSTATDTGSTDTGSTATDTGSTDTGSTGGGAPESFVGSNASLLDTLDRIATVLASRDMSDDELDRLAVVSERMRAMAACEL